MGSSNPEHQGNDPSQDLAASFPLLPTRIARAGTTQHTVSACCVCCVSAPALETWSRGLRCLMTLLSLCPPLETYLLPHSEQRGQSPDHDRYSPVISVVSMQGPAIPTSCPFPSPPSPGLPVTLLPPHGQTMGRLSASALLTLVPLLGRCSVNRSPLESRRGSLGAP